VQDTQRMIQRSRNDDSIICRRTTSQIPTVRTPTLEQLVYILFTATQPQ